MPLLMVEGPFGEAVGRKLAGADWEVCSFRDQLSVGFDAVRGHGYAALATWRLALGRSHELESACRLAGGRYGFAFLEGRYLYLGPACYAEEPPCFECFRRRLVTHTSAPERLLAVEAAFAATPDLGVPGHIAMMADMAAAYVLAESARPSVVGSLVRIDVLGCVVQRSRVVRVHGCRTCAPPGERSSRRFVDTLVPKLHEGLT